MLAKPYSKILYKTKVTKIDVKKNEKINDLKYYQKKPDMDENSSFVRLRKLRTYPIDDSNPYSLAKLHANGLDGNIQGKRSVSGKILSYILNPYSSNLSVKKGKISMPNIDKNTIFYGVPGTGKSYRVKQLIKENNIPDEDVFRATLHPEFSYSNFIGQVLPDVNRKGEPTYKYQKGIFTKALERALKVDDPVLLILEEMSRANVAAVFGDIFQLLDRDQAGKSDYGIDNDLIYNHLDEEAQNALKGKKIILPENLYIIGTVNTSDQNVFPMDNAFKRRFSWKYVSIETPDDENNPELTIKVGKGNQVTEYPVKWSELLFKLNEFIVSRDKGLGLTEDKQLGPYFIKFNDTNDIKTNDELIKNKLLQYLWDDVQNSMAAFGNANITLFDKSIYSFSELYECHDKQQIFSNEFLGKDYLDLLNQEVDNHEE